MKKVKIGLLLATFCTVSVFAQEGTEPQAPATESVPAVETTEPAAEPAAEPQAELTPEQAAEQAAQQAAAEEAARQAAEQAAAEEAARQAAEQAAAEEARQAAEKAAVEEAARQAALRAQSEIKFHLGGRIGAGISAIRNHKALKTGTFSNKIQGSYIQNPYAIILKPAFSFGIGAAAAFEINSLFTIAPELQYTLYRTNGEFTQQTGDSYPELNEAGVSLHSFELPILARFSFNLIGKDLYAELGPQLGYNYSANMYQNFEKKKPELNAFAFGPSIGAGLKLDSTTLVGVRAHLGILEYAKNTTGYPWTVQASATRFFF